MRPRLLFPVLAAALLLGACQPDKTAALPPPQEPGPDAVGVICHMELSEHRGPKGQAFLKGDTAPLWFSSARETLDWMLDDGASKPLTAVYVNDMGRAANWDQPTPGAWVEVHGAVFVVGSDKASGMGGGEFVPFAQRAAAEAFARNHGGRLLAFAQIDRRVLEQSGPDGEQQSGALPESR